MSSLPQVRYCCETCGQPIDHAQPKRVSFQGVSLDAKTVVYGGKEANLSQAAAAVFRALVLGDGKRSTEALIMISGSESDAADEILRVYISHIRRALEWVGAPFIIRNLRGWGYVLVPVS